MRRAGAGRRWAALGALVALLAVVPSAGANIATKPLLTWQTNGRVLAILQVGSTTYVGGKFSQISNHDGTMTQDGLEPGRVQQPREPRWRRRCPRRTARSRRLPRDGSGNIFFGGSFTKVGTSGRKPHRRDDHRRGRSSRRAPGPARPTATSRRWPCPARTCTWQARSRRPTGRPARRLRRWRSRTAACSRGRRSSTAGWTASRSNGGNIVAGGFFPNAGSRRGRPPLARRVRRHERRAAAGLRHADQLAGRVDGRGRRRRRSTSGTENNRA